MTGRVLLVEDAPEFREFVTQALRREGYDVESVGDGCQALATIEREAPDAVICDVVLPRKSGFALLEEIRQLNRQLPVILTSTWDADYAREQARDLGASAFVQKDTDPRNLLRTLRSCLGRKTRWSLPTAPPIARATVLQRRLSLGNDPTLVLSEFCAQAAPMLHVLPTADRVSFAQGVALASRVVIACGNLSMPPECLTEPDIEAIMVERGRHPPFCRRALSAMVVLETDRLRTSLIDQGPGFDYRALARDQLALAEQCAGRMLFPTKGRTVELVRDFSPPLGEDQVSSVLRDAEGQCSP